MTGKSKAVVYNRDSGDACFRSLLTPHSARTEFGRFLIGDLGRPRSVFIDIAARKFSFYVPAFISQPL